MKGRRRGRKIGNWYWLGVGVNSGGCTPLHHVSIPELRNCRVMAARRAIESIASALLFCFFFHYFHLLLSDFLHFFLLFIYVKSFKVIRFRLATASGIWLKLLWNCSEFVLKSGWCCQQNMTKTALKPSRNCQWNMIRISEKSVRNCPAKRLVLPAEYDENRSETAPEPLGCCQWNTVTLSLRWPGRNAPSFKFDA